ncbi:hypothetical protein [Streptomyces scabiei]|uniref:hypothetical protein n=1 Tax=Streptomyces scabiei TaxID=1930 RepID=UPI001B3414EA|nr:MULTISPECIES: hypothetical protein [Streptomyces]MBP5892818.1 hypothetical protein [Streptomyces sp. LBUM 1481]MBP5923084.1 hypothetical protein [Streptomyces sp. LBUM 1483]MDX2686860.1 hypothetical protein [Streptomyces scabiei]MDX2753070.1 hypothetical protein [Streptomyces scabiei]MDX2807259.1 hypothetical protein [Streptomyces scabiei]
MSEPRTTTLRTLAREILADALAQTGRNPHTPHIREMATRIGALEQAVRIAITLLDAEAGETR